MRIDEIPTHEISGVSCRQGRPLPFGATAIGNGIVNFSVNSTDATGCTLVLFHRGEAEPFAEIEIPEIWRVGNNFSVMVFDQNIDTLEYGYRFDGPYEPENCHLFDKRNILLDPYAKLFSGNEVWRKPMYEGNAFPIRGRILQEDYDWDGDVKLNYEMEDLVIYEMHVRGFTKHFSSGVKYPGTYAGVVEKIPYLKELGVNCVELMPVFEFDENEYRFFKWDKRACNFWGYSTVGFYAPKAGYAASGIHGFAADEFKGMVKKLHQAGIEVILDVVFNHTSEMGWDGPVRNYKGICSKNFYYFDPDGAFSNYSGCGNTVRCNHPVVRNYIKDCLRYWVSDFHIDGFRFDLASIMSRDDNGEPMKNPPILRTLAMDPILARTKLIAEAWDAAGLYQVGSFPGPERWAEWNGKFRDCVRHFLRGEAAAGIDLVQRLQGSPDIFSHKNARATINFVNCHDGFTLHDLVSYNEKHNESNGENNRDGSNDNISWNCGIEGETDLRDVNHTRNKLIKNAVTLLMISRGIPMFPAGDEFRNTQFGNNNAYCQDNDISWLDWSRIDQFPDTLDYFKKIIAFRKKHPIFRKATYDIAHNSSGYPEISFHGLKAWEFREKAPKLGIGVLYAEPKADFEDVDQDAFIYVAMNSHWEPLTFELPIIPMDFQWHRVLSTADDEHGPDPHASSRNYSESRRLTVESRSILILEATRW